MRFSVAIQGSLRAYLREEADAVRTAEIKAVREAGEAGKNLLRKHYAGLGLRQIGYRWKAKYYTRDRSRPPMAVLFPRGRASKEIAYGFEHGMTIHAKNGRYLWIPTQWNKRRGRRTRNDRAGNAIIKPSEIIDGFVRKGRKPGTLVVYSPVTARQRETPRGRQATDAYVNHHRLGSGRGGRTRKILSHGAVPLFTLVRQTRISARTDLDAMKREIAAEFKRDLAAVLARELS